MFCQPRSQEKGGEKGASTPSPPPPLLSMVKQSIADGRYGLEDCRAVVVSGGHPPTVTCFRVCVFRLVLGCTMAYQTIRQEYLQIPIVTRVYSTACIITTLSVVSEGVGGVSLAWGCLFNRLPWCCFFVLLLPLLFTASRHRNALSAVL